MMSNGAAVADADRLPWLEPHREAPKPRARTPRARKPRPRKSGKPLAIAGVMALFVAAGAGGYWFGRSGAPLPVIEPAAFAPASEPSATAVVPLPEPAPLVVPARPREAEPNAAPPAIEPQAQVERQATAKPVRKKAVRRYRPKRKIRSAGIERARLDAVRAEQESALAKPVPTTAAPKPVPTAAPPKPAPTAASARAWPKMPSPGPAGQVIQLGAFRHPNSAYTALHARLARYPALGRMPRVILPIAPARNGKIYYVLRLGTTSRIQSTSVCRNLRRSGDHCVVIG